MNEKEIEKLKVDDIIMPMTEEDVAIALRARNKINAIKSTIETLTDKLAREYKPVNELWKKYDPHGELSEALLKRGLGLSICYERECVKVSKISDDELKRALSHNLYW